MRYGNITLVNMLWSVMMLVQDMVVLTTGNPSAPICVLNGSLCHNCLLAFRSWGEPLNSRQE